MKLENAFLRITAKAIENKAIVSAGRVSNKGWCEAKVPDKLLEQNNKKH